MPRVCEFSLMELYLNILNIWHCVLFRIWDWSPQRGFFWMKWNGLNLDEVQGEVCSLPLQNMLLWHWDLISMATGQGIDCCRYDMMTTFWFRVCHTFFPSLDPSLPGYIFPLASGLIASEWSLDVTGGKQMFSIQWIFLELAKKKKHYSLDLSKVCLTRFSQTSSIIGHDYPYAWLEGWGFNGKIKKQW